MRTVIAALATGILALALAGCTGDTDGSGLVKIELPLLLGRHGGPRSVVGKFATGAGAEVGGARVVAAELRLRGTATESRQFCCSCNCDTFPQDYVFTVSMSGSRGEQVWLTFVHVNHAGPFEATGAFRTGWPDTNLDHMAASMDSLLVVGYPAPAVCCEPVGPDPEVTITGAELVLRLDRARERGGAEVATP